MNAYLLALSLLAPVGADPAPPTFSIPVDSRVVMPDGRVLVIRGTLTGTLEEPPPPPVGPTITALRNAAGQGVEQIRAGEVLTIEGVQLTKAGAQVRVQLPGHLAQVVEASPTKLVVRWPAVAAPVTGPLLIYHNSGSGWVEVARLPRFTLLPAQAPGKPIIRSFSDATIRGEGFGPEPGQVWLDWFRVPVLTWREGEIRLEGLALGNPWYLTTIQVETAGGEWVSYGGRVE